MGLGLGVCFPLADRGNFPLSSGPKLSPGEVAKWLYGSFSWSHSPQGAEYWSEVYRNLLDLEALTRKREGMPLLKAVVFGRPDDDAASEADL